MNKDFNKKLEEFKIREQSHKIINRINYPKSSIAMGFKISMDFVVSIIVGTLIGLGIDMFFLTNPIFFLIFLLLGILAGTLNMYRTVIKLEKEKKNRK